MKKILLAILLSSIPLTIAGAESDSEIITLDECVEQSLLNSEQLKIAHEKTSETELKVSEVWGSLWPDFSTKFSATRVSADKGFNSFNNGNYSVRFINGEIQLNPGVFYESLKLSRDNRVVAVSDERRIQAETVESSINLYYRIMLQSELVKLREISVAALDENLRIVNAGFKTGSATNLDFLRAKVSAANEKTRLIAAQNDYMNAVASILLSMGKEIRSYHLITAPMRPADEKEIHSFATMTEAEKINQVAAYTSTALKNRPEVIQLEYKKRSEKDSRAATEALYLWPTLFAEGGYGSTMLIQKNTGSSSTGDPQIDGIVKMLDEEFSPKGWNRDWSVTVGASIHWGGLVPFDERNIKARSQSHRVNASELEMSRFIKSVRLEVQNSFLKLVSAASAIESQKENIDSAEEYFRVATVQYKSGLIDNQKLLESNAELQNAKTMYVQALFDYQTAKAEMNRAAGSEIFSF